MLAINLHTKTIRIKHAVHAEYIDERSTYVELNDFWMGSPCLPGYPPFGFDTEHWCMFMAGGWELRETNIHGEIVRTLL